jgi:hypothetical protein
MPSDTSPPGFLGAGARERIRCTLSRLARVSAYFGITLPIPPSGEKMAKP